MFSHITCCILRSTMAQLEVLDLSYTKFRPSLKTLQPLPLGLEELHLAGQHKQMSNLQLIYLGQHNR